MRIGVDLLGSDRSPQELFNAVLEAGALFESLHSLLIFVDQKALDSFTQEQKAKIDLSRAAIDFHLSSQEILMRDDPVDAARKKKNSSMVQGLQGLKRGDIDAFVSAGNTGALLTSSSMILSRLPGVHRPGLLAMLPTEKGLVSIVDVGGNLRSKAEELLTFAQLGKAFQEVFFGNRTPAIGLLNIGTESKKGTEELRSAHQLLSAKVEGFIGNIEGSAIFKGLADLIVTEGFTGNILLKTAEGLALMMLKVLKQSKHASPALLKELFEMFSLSEYPGALLLGVDGVVVKCHGDSSADALLNGIKTAAAYVDKGLIAKLKAQLTSPHQK